MSAVRPLFALRLFASAWPALSIACALACESTDDPKHPVVEGDILLEAADNYQATMDLTIPDIPFDPAAAVTFDWQLAASGNNIRQEPTKPIQKFVLAKYPGPRAAAEQAIENGTVSERALSPIEVNVVPGNTTLTLAEVGAAANYFTAASTTFIVTLSTGTTAGYGVQAVAFLVPTPGEPATTLVIDEGAKNLASFTPKFGATVPIPAVDPGSIGWGSVGVNGLLQPTDAQALKDVNRVILAYFAGRTTADLENQTTFLQLESQANVLYEAAIVHSGPEPTSALELSTLANKADGTAFVGFTERAGTWIFAAMCDACNNPAIVLSVLNPITE